jgi:hypothetical protein
VPAVRIENRAQLIYLLTEAAEIEHNVLCCYLFTQFSMKSATSEGLTAAQLEKVRSWRRTIGDIAVQEMLHLASACNLLTAVGGAPQLRRPNLPTSPRAYPSAFELRLVPFSLEAVEQFVFLERPEDVDDRPEASYRDSALAVSSLRDVFSCERDYNTLGELYRGIEDGLRYLAQKLGEENLFIGAARSQTGGSLFQLAELVPVHDLDSALAALNVIIEQGEGASPDALDSHYQRFQTMRDEYRDLLAADPQFQPGRPVLQNPYALMPADVSSRSDVNLIDDPLSLDVCSLFDSCYELTVQILGRLFVHAEESESEFAALADTSVGMMVDVVLPLGGAITLLPAGPAHPGLTAGPSFRLSRGATIPTQKDAARFVLRERLLELAASCRFLQASPGAPAVLTDVQNALEKFAQMLASASA